MEMKSLSETLDVERAVRERYARGALAREAALCCPTEYDPRFLTAIPQEVLERDYGCGDPSRHIREEDTVLDLGSGAGKIWPSRCSVGDRGPEPYPGGAVACPTWLSPTARRSRPTLSCLGGPGR